jgi:hypothetical protein
MQTKIHNPYQAQLDADKVPQHLLISFSNLSIGFDEGVEAVNRPKSFADELPEEGQRIFSMLKNGSAECCLFFSSCLSGYEYKEQGVFYTHWMLFPTF